MRGLARTSPTFASVKISGRCARKHYGTSCEGDFIKGLHNDSRRWVSMIDCYQFLSILTNENPHSYFSRFYGKYMVDNIEWFIKKVNIHSLHFPSLH